MVACRTIADRISHRRVLRATGAIRLLLAVGRFILPH
jgi:hypothetical protein